MHVFITGGTGLIGSAVITELLAHGHSMRALVRSDASAQVATALGADPVRGSIDDLAVLHSHAQQADGVIHLAFANDFSTPDALTAAVAEESAAIATLGQALIGSGKPFVTVSGTPIISGRLSTEADPALTEGPVGGRGRAVVSALALASQGVRSSAVRLPRTVHNKGMGGFAGLLTNIAGQTGTSGYPGDGLQRWPAVHALDAAVLFRLALEQAEAGTSWHAVGDEGDAVKDIAGVIGRRLGLPVASVSPDSFGALGAIFAADQPASSHQTQAMLGWRPSHPALLADLENL